MFGAAAPPAWIERTRSVRAALGTAQLGKPANPSIRRSVDQET
jgi:hypothetical protein